MGKRSEELAKNKAKRAKLIVVRKKSVPGTHLAVIKSVTLCGWLLRWKEEGNCEEVNEEATCEVCRTVVDVICEEFE